MKKRKAVQGFVLAELIVAIALLALVSGIILQLFLVASTSNKNARDLDSASSRAVSVMERLRILDHGTLEQDPVFAGARIERLPGELNIYFAYDSDWAESDAPGKNGYELLATVKESRVQRELGDAFSGDDTDTGNPMQAAYLDIDIDVLSYRTDNETGETTTETLVSFSSGKYLLKGGAQ